MRFVQPTRRPRPLTRLTRLARLARLARLTRFARLAQQVKTRIVTLFDTFGEMIKLEKPVDMVGNIEEWLSKLLASMQHAVNSIVRDASQDCEVMPLEEFTHKYPAQVSLLGIQIKWTLDCEDALYRARNEKQAVNSVVKKNQIRLTELVRLNLKPDQELNVHGHWTRTKIETMILVDVHQRDCFEDIAKLKIKEPEHFEWQKQARAATRSP
jgi:dynein heavy chain, axonemal